MKNNQPAFPTVHQNNDGTTQNIEGMILRDYFAAHTDVSLYNFKTNEAACEFLGIEPFDFTDMNKMIEFGMSIEAKLQYLKADAMLKQRDL